MHNAVIIIILAVIIFGFVKKVNIFDCFLAGAKGGVNTCISLIPTLVGLVVAVDMLRSSGVLDAFCAFLAPFCNYIGIPKEIIPMAIFKPISGSASTALLKNIFETYSPDSIIGQITSVMAGSTETTFYAITVYFSSVGISKTKHTLPCALFADLVAVVVSVLTVNILLY